MKKNKALFYVAVLILLVFTTISTMAQNMSPKSDSLRKDALNIYVYCPYCDLAYVKKEITYVNYMRDQKEAQVYVLVTSQTTGSGGTEYSMNFIGQKESDGHTDTLKFNTEPTATDDEIRIKITSYMKMGLMSYVAKTPLAEKIAINFESYSAPEVIKDPWKSWVFSIYGNGYINGQESLKQYYLYSSLSANQITEKHKLKFSGSYSYNQAKYKIDDTTEFVSNTNSKYFSSLYVKSLTDHWSAGGGISASTSTYSNIDFGCSFRPALEYDFFKYSESTQKQLCLLYEIVATHRNYNDTTIFNKKKEELISNSLTASIDFTQKWGTISSSLTWSNYFHDFSKNSLSWYAYFSVRIFKGLSVNSSTNISLMHDQLNIPKAGASAEEILTQQKQLASQYSYYSSVGLTYTFGSIYNNVVNPRFSYY